MISLAVKGHSVLKLALSSEHIHNLLKSSAVIVYDFLLHFLTSILIFKSSIECELVKINLLLLLL